MSSLSHALLSSRPDPAGPTRALISTQPVAPAPPNSTPHPSARALAQPAHTAAPTPSADSAPSSPSTRSARSRHARATPFPCLPPRAGPSLPLARSDDQLPQPRRPALASPARSVPDRPGLLVSSSARSRGRSRSIFPLSPTRRPHMAAPSPPRSNNRARSAEIPGGPSIRGTTPQDQRSRFINGAPHP